MTSTQTNQMPPRRGIFITVEGIDGSGKTVLLDALASWLAELGVSHVRTREPGGTGVDQNIRSLLLDPKVYWSFKAELMLFLADRAQHVAQVINPALNEGKAVLCDRYIDTTYAYQAWGRNMDRATVKKLCAFVAGDAIPDITLVLDLPVDEARARLDAAGKGDRMDGQSELFYRRAREGFHELATTEDRVRVIDARQSQEDVLACAKAMIGRHLTSRYRTPEQAATLRADKQGEHVLFRWSL